VARAPSFLTAATVTWLLNRKHTFKDLARHSTGTEYRRYIMSQVAGALANLAVYATAIASIPWCAKYPVAALAFGAVFGLVVNYSLARFYVFPGSRP
jgi:putative flippase GtrA